MSAPRRSEPELPDDDLVRAAKRYRLLTYDRLKKELNDLPEKDRNKLEEYAAVEMYDEIKKRVAAMPVVQQGILYRELCDKKNPSLSDLATLEAINEDYGTEPTDPRIEIERIEGSCGTKMSQYRRNAD